MEAAYRGEMLTPSRCGRMDQVSDVFLISRRTATPSALQSHRHTQRLLHARLVHQCVAMGAGSVGLMTFDTDGCQVPIKQRQSFLLAIRRQMHACLLPARTRSAHLIFLSARTQLRVLACRAPLHFVVADLRAAKDTVVILKALQACFPFPADSVQVRRARPGPVLNTPVPRASSSQPVLKHPFLPLLVYMSVWGRAACIGTHPTTKSCAGRQWRPSRPATPRPWAPS